MTTTLRLLVVVVYKVEFLEILQILNHVVLFHPETYVRALPRLRLIPRQFQVPSSLSTGVLYVA